MEYEYLEIHANEKNSAHNTYKAGPECISTKKCIYYIHIRKLYL